MRLEQLTCLVATAETGSISAAAQRLIVSRPSVSAALKCLEKELGTSLFLKGNKGSRLTQQGRIICEKAAKALELLHEIQNVAQAKLEGTFSLCAQPLSSYHLTSNILSPFHELYPKINVAIRNTYLTDVVNELKSGSSSMAVVQVAVGLAIREQAKSIGCEITPIYTDERKLFIGAQHPLAAKKQLTPDDLKKLHIAYHSYSHSNVSSRYAPYFSREYRLATREDIIDVVLRNEAIIIQPGRLFCQDSRVRSGALVEKNIPLPNIDHAAPIVAIRVQKLSAIECLFWEYLLENFARGL